MDILEKVCERMNKELEEQYMKIEKTSQITPSDLEIIDTILHSLKSVKTVMAMEKGNDHKDKYRHSLIAELEDKMKDVHSEDEAIAIQDAINALRAR